MSESSLNQFWDDNRQNITYVAAAGALVVAGIAVYRRFAPEHWSVRSVMNVFSWRSKKVDFDLEKDL